MLGMSIFDFVHPCDHDELRTALNQINEDANANKKTDSDCSMKAAAMPDTTTSTDKDVQQFDSKSHRNLFNDNGYVSFMVRIKCTLNNKSKCVPLKSANYKVSDKFSL